MATKTGVWDLQEVRDKQLASEWSYDSPVSGYLWAWGENGSGTMGVNDRTNYSSPKQVGTNSTWSVLNNSGSESQMAVGIKSDGTLWTWGRNYNGSLGLNDTAWRSSPTQVPGTYLVPSDEDPYNDRTGTIASRNSTQAIKSDGTLWTMGYNEFGQFGFGSNGDQLSSPTQVGTDTTWKHITTGRDSGFVAIKTDGTLWSWGRNRNGTLGLGNQTSVSSPTQVGSDTTWLGVTMQAQTTHAIKTDGTLWVWGGNGYGTLGLNNTTSHYSPVQIPGTWRNCGVTVGDGQLAFKSDGTLWAWGRNENGIYGNNTQGDASSRSSPTQVGTDTNWQNATAIRAQSSVMATKTDGTLWAWGANQKGILGQNQSYQVERSSPTQIGTDTTWQPRLAGGYANSFAIKS